MTPKEISQRLEQLEAELDLETEAYTRSCSRLEDARSDNRRAYGNMQHLQGQIQELRELARRGSDLEREEGGGA